MTRPILSESDEYKFWRSRFAQRVPHSFDQNVNLCGQQRGRDFLFPIILSGRGYGPYYEDSKGNVYLDLIGSIGVHILGCAHPVLKSSALQAAQNGFTMQTHLFPGEEYIRLVSGLSALALEQVQLDRCWLASTGASALGIGVQLGLSCQPPARQKILSFRETYFANSIDSRRLHEMTFLTFPKKGDAEIESLSESLISEIGVFVFEPFLGEGGFWNLEPEIFLKLLRLLKERGVSIIADETQTFLKSSEPFACRAMGYSGLVDIVTVGKSLQGAAVFFKKEITPPPGVLSGTFAGSTAALAAGHAVVDYMSGGDFFGSNGRIAKINLHFVSGIQRISSRLARLKITNIESCGLMIAFSIGGATTDSVLLFLKRLFKAGLLVSVCGLEQTRVRFHLPAVIEVEEMDLALRIIEDELIAHSEL